MYINELIDYKEEHRKVLKQCEDLGIDTGTLMNPDLRLHQIEDLEKLAKFNIKVDPKHINIIDYIAVTCYLRNGCLKNEYRLTQEYKEKQSKQQIAQQEYSYNDTNYAILESLNINTDEVYTSEDLYNALLKHHGVQGKYHNELEEYIGGYLPMDYLSYYYKTKGTDGLIPNDDDIGLNRLVITLHYQHRPDYEKVIEKIRNEKTPKNKKSLILMVVKEYKYTNRVDISTDENYSVYDRRAILDIYVETGIDVRITPHSTKIINRIRNIDFHREEKILEVMTKTFSKEELKLYREISNKFRYDSIEQGVVREK